MGGFQWYENMILYFLFNFYTVGNICVKCIFRKGIEESIEKSNTIKPNQKEASFYILTDNIQVSFFHLLDRHVLHGTMGHTCLFFSVFMFVSIPCLCSYWGHGHAREVRRKVSPRPQLILSTPCHCWSANLSTSPVWQHRSSRVSIFSYWPSQITWVCINTRLGNKESSRPAQGGKEVKKQSQ